MKNHVPHLSLDMTDGHFEVGPGVQLAYLDRGSGRPIVFVPGWTFAKEIFEKQIGHYSRSFRVIAVDPRSQGASTLTLQGNDYETHSADLVALLDHLGVSNPILVGWSAGGVETWGYVKLKGAEAIAAHIAIDLPPKQLSTDPEAWVEGPLDEVANVHRTYLRNASGQAEFIKLYTETAMVQRPLAKAEMDWIVSQSLKCIPLIAAQLFANAVFSDRTNEALAINAARPSLFVIAEHWAETAVAFIRRSFPRSETAVLGGHMMFWEHPEAFNRILDSFINENVS